MLWSIDLSSIFKGSGILKQNKMKKAYKVIVDPVSFKYQSGDHFSVFAAISIWTLNAMNKDNKAISIL